jgi:DNA-binding LacI/PurR family transcriptional regulator
MTFVRPADVHVVIEFEISGEAGRPNAARVRERLGELDALREARFAGSAPDGQARSIALVFTHWTIADDEHAFFGPLVRGIRDEAAVRDCDVILCAPSRDHWLEEDAVARMVHHGTDGLIVLGGADGNPDVLGTRFQGLPSVFVEYDVLGSRSAHVGIDNEQAFGELIVHLASTGHSRIATITGSLDMRVSAERLSAYRGTLARLGYSVRSDYVQPGDFLSQSGYDAMNRLLALDVPPDAVAAACDAQAVGAIQAIEEAGLRCPEDIAVTGFDDAVWAGLMRPALTTVRQPAAAMGAAAVDSLLAMIENPALEPPKILLEGELVVRESCGAPFTVAV